MDPNANLEEQRSLVQWLIAHPDEDTSTEAARLADLVQALDEWLTGGGFLPNPWRRDGP